MSENFGYLLFIVSITAYAGLKAYQVQGAITAALVTVIVGWVMWNVRNESEFLSSLNVFFDPVKFSLLSFGLGFSYLALKGFTLPENMAFSVSFLLFGALASMLIFKYWNIGG